MSRDGNLEIEEDVAGWEYDPEKKQNVWVSRPFEHKLKLTSVGDIPTDERDPKFKHFVFSGEKDPEKKAWKDTPWYRVTTQYMSDEDLWRFYSRYRDDVTGKKSAQKKNHQQVIRYVPTFDDFQVQEYGEKANFHLPVWLLDIIIADGLVDIGKRYTRDSLGKNDKSAIPWVTEEQVQDMLGIYEKRKANEDEDNAEVARIKEKYKELRTKDSTQLMNNGRKQQAAEKAAEKDRIMAQVEAEKALAAVKAEQEKLKAEKDEIAKMKEDLMKEIASLKVPQEKLKEEPEKKIIKAAVKK